MFVLRTSGWVLNASVDGYLQLYNLDHSFYCSHVVFETDRLKHPFDDFGSQFKPHATFNICGRKQCVGIGKGRRVRCDNFIFFHHRGRKAEFGQAARSKLFLHLSECLQPEVTVSPETPRGTAIVVTTVVLLCFVDIEECGNVRFVLYILNAGTPRDCAGRLTKLVKGFSCHKS